MSLTKSPEGADLHLCLRLLAGRTGCERHTSEHVDEICPYVPILDVPVPQMGEQLVDFFKFLDVQSPVEEVIDVAKIPEDSNQQPLVDRDSRVPQMAEHLVEVPTVLTLAVLAKQIVDIPVPRGRGLTIQFPRSWISERFSTFFPQGQNPATFVEQSVDIPVPAG